MNSPELLSLTVETSDDYEDVELITATFSDYSEVVVTDTQMAHLLYFKDRFIGRHRLYTTADEIFECPHNSIFIVGDNVHTPYVYILDKQTLDEDFLYDMAGDGRIYRSNIQNLLDASGMRRVF